VVGLWSSIVVGLIGGTLAVVAIIFTRSVDKQNNTLNQRFTEVLTSINGKSENTERQINTMVSRIVETYLDLRPSGIPQAIQEPQGDGAGGEDDSSELRRFMARTNQSLDEIRLRQRVQPITAAEIGLPPLGTPFQDYLNARRYRIGEKVRLLESHPEAELRGKIGTVESIASSGFPVEYAVRIEGPSGILRNIQAIYLELLST